MRAVAKGIRQARFKIVEAKVEIVFESKTGKQFVGKVENCSLNGLGARVTGKVTAAEGLDSGDLVPSAKLKWDDHEYPIGRLVLRSIRQNGSGTLIGFSTVDSKVPIDGDLSRYLEKHRDSEKNAYGYELNPDTFNLASFVESSHNNVDILNRCEQFSIFLNEWEKTPKFQYRTVREPSMGERVKLSKRRKQNRNDYIIMGSNDYLGLASHPEVRRAAANALEQYGFGSTGSPVTTGRSKLHAELEMLLAETLKKEAVLLYNSGYTANVGAIAGLTSERDLILADVLSHASIQDAIQMSRATSRFFKHNDMKHLRRLLEENRSKHSGALIITEGLFSMDGDFPPLDDIIKIAKEYNTRIFVDEAHSFGVIGPNGLGAADMYHKLDDTDILMGTFSKICGSIGGFIAGSQDLINWLNFFSRAHTFSVSLPPSTVAATLKSLEIFLRDRSLLDKLHSNIKHFVNGMRGLGYPIDPNHQSAIVPVVIGDEAKMGEINKYLMDAGVFVVPIVYPAVSRKQCRFRFTVMATHSISDLDYVLNVMEMALEKVGFSFAEEKSEEDNRNFGQNRSKMVA